MKNCVCIRLHTCTSISSILYEFSSSFIRCASAGVNLLHVAGSLLRSYTVAENVSYTDKLFANTNRFAAPGDVLERGSVVLAGMVDSTGADEFGWEKRVG